ncbi:unnamed protein product [Caenorhabditis bovis]|uniref:DNA polymerase n=1 Tax=Caenorhabditis bovis TaxID=2654633 RepID=A0A8S1EKT1_9PELO|nr:unnamed protein product [Caenorhabditis bovis]
MSDTENVTDADVRRSSRRRESAKVTSRKNALEAMKEARRSGKGYKPNLEVNDVYEVVDEDEYNDIVRKRQNDNFVVDDDGMGYVDTGVDFDDEYDEYADEENAKKSKNRKNKAKKEKKKGALDSFLAAGQTKKAVFDDSKVKVNLEEDEDLKNMLGDILDGPDEEEETAPPPPPPKSRNPFKRERTSSPDAFEASMAPRPIAKKAKTNFLAKTPKVGVVKQAVKLEEPEEPEEADDFDYGIPDVEEAPVEFSNDSQKTTDVEKVKIDESPDDVMETDEAPTSKLLLTAEEWNADTNEAVDEPIDVKTGAEEFYVMGGENGDQKAIRMYWIDAFEDVHKNSGTVFLFGKLKVSKNQWASCCCIVRKMPRQVFFMPRETNLATNEPIQDVDVFNEIRSVLKKNLNLNEFKCRPIEKRLMNDKQFGENAGEKTRLMEVQYESTHPKLPSDLTGSTFSKIFNTTTTPLEHLLIEKRFMGPGWIELFNFNESSAKMSNCDYEFSVDMEKMKNIRYLEGNSDEKLPNVRLLAINVITTINEKKENEICMISMLNNPKSSLVHPSCATKDLQRISLVTRPVGGTLPFDIKKRLESEQLSGIATTTANEKALLTLFLAKLNQIEPDIIVGHDLSAMVSILVSRLEKLKIPNWSRMSRLKRTINIGKVGHSKAGQWELTAGRLLLDSKLAAMELMKSRSYDISELSMKMFGYKRHEIYANDIGPMYSSSERLINLIKWSWADPLLSLRIVVELNALPLFTQITNIVGGVASRTLMGGRAERNEYLLMHAFHKSELIAPDKFNANAKRIQKASDDDDDGGDEHKAGKSKAQYSGGLVLEPKKGLYDTLILLLDFNSLYPSIIQEYNICFTTVSHTKDGDELPELPSASFEEGVLPREIRKLVECRRNVKNLMKTEKKEADRKQMDIRQMALKLTANSMYGCLGFQYSRFYAKPLAALVTAKGREILMHSKDLVESLGYSVIYGDTDSIMINTNSLDLAQAKKLGTEIKKQVNKCHRLLELDLDGVFKRMLLLKKKKYAALTINPDTKVESKELKGLDIVRRDWSQLAKETGTAVVDRILDPELSRDELVSSIDDLLRQMRSELDAGNVAKEKFQISKQLTKNPKDYADLKAQPHAAVAKRLNESGRFNLRHGDIVEYIICEDGTGNPATQRAYHRTEMDENNELKIDLIYYLAQQVHPVVCRLCAPIEETDAVRIAECLGLDATSYRRAAAATAAQCADEEDYMWQQENYDLCEGLAIRCPLSGCGETSVIRAVFDFESDASSPRIRLSSCAKCQRSWLPESTMAIVANQIDRQLGDFVARHMSAGYKCDEPTCEYRTRLQTMKWCREGLECVKCSTGILRKEYTSKQLFDQQMFIHTLLDVENATKSMDSTQLKSAKMRAEFVCAKEALLDLKMHVEEKFLRKNAYNQVDLSYIFAPMLKIR